MMLCSKCNKRPSVVFVSNTANPSETVGYCLVCAKEMGIKPVTDIMEKMGISEDDLANIQDQMDDLAQSGVFPDMEELDDNQDLLSEDDEDDDFSRGGAPTFPPFFKNLFNSKSPSDKLSENEGKNGKTDEKQNKRDQRKRRKNRKHIDSYCTNLTQRAADGKLDRIIGREKIRKYSFLI